MKKRFLIFSAILSIGSAMASGTDAVPSTPASPCDRSCLRGLADRMLDAMVKHDPAGVPLTPRYRATENSVGMAPNSMGIWQTAESVKTRFYIIDAISHQLFMIVRLSEGRHDVLLHGRILAVGQRISEIELYENRGHGQDGFEYLDFAPTPLPVEWTEDVPQERIPARAELQKYGKSMFDPNVAGPVPSTDCVLWENGKTVIEYPTVAATAGMPIPKHLTGKGFTPNADGTIPIPCGSPPGRPSDPKARSTIVDDQTGFIVSMAMIAGQSVPYLVVNPPQSVMVPFEMLPGYKVLLDQQIASGKQSQPILQPMDVMAATTQIERVYDGKMQAMALLLNLGAPGGRSPWTE